MITGIDFQGSLIGECRLDAERKSNDIFPAHISGMPLSRDRWLITCATRGIRYHDDDHSIIYQLRAKTPDGALIREGMIQPSVTDYDPRGDGSAYVRLCRVPMPFGVPQGALVGASVPAHSGLCGVIWCTSAAGTLDPVTGVRKYDAALEGSTIHAEWCQFRLNAAGDDIEMLLPPQKMRQVGYARGPAFCSHTAATTSITPLVPALPLDPGCTEWCTTHHFNTGIAAIKLRYNPRAGLYEWVETGPALPQHPDFAFSEGALARSGTSWIMAVRARRERARKTPDWAGGFSRDCGDTAWLKTADPFAPWPEPVILQEPNRIAPFTLFTCADRQLRLFSGDFTNSPHKQRRDPLYCWDVDPGDFSVSERHVVLDSVQAGIFADDATPRSTCFCAVFPHMGGKVQLAATRAMAIRYRPGVEPNSPPVTAEQFAKFGVYYFKLHYAKDCPPAWRFTGN